MVRNRASDEKSRRHILRRLTGLLVLAWLAGCSSQPRHHGTYVPKEPAPSEQSLLTGEACLAKLDQDGVSFTPMAPPNDPHPCGADTPVRLSGLGSARLNRPVTSGCALADTLARWEKDVVEPDARRYLGREIAGVTSYGAYYCRKEVGNGRNYVSMHAYGLAIDIAGWRLSDGNTIGFAKDWNSGGPADIFLHAVTRSACRYFSVVLTPDSNAAHQNHVHLDIGPYRYCGHGKE